MQKQSFDFSNQQDIEISDEGEYGMKTLSLKEIILRHLRKISDICCKEFTGGYWQKRPVRTPSGVMFIEEYHEDVREAYCNAVDFLIDVLYPDSDDDFRDYIKENEKIDNEEKDIKKKIIKKRETFRKITEMFERTGYFQSIGVENE